MPSPLRTRVLRQKTQIFLFVPLVSGVPDYGTRGDLKFCVFPVRSGWSSNRDPGRETSFSNTFYSCTAPQSRSRFARQANSGAMGRATGNTVGIPRYTVPLGTFYPYGKVDHRAPTPAMARSKQHTRRPVPRTPYSDSHTRSSVYMGYGPSFDDGHPQESSDANSATSKNSNSATFQSPSLNAKGGGCVRSVCTISIPRITSEG